VSAFEEAFGVPAGHVLRLVRIVRRGLGADVWEREHEEYDREGRLVAVYESWSCGGPSPAGREGGAGGRGGFVKYAPDGRILRRCDAAPAWSDDVAGPVAA
jgi:hypothetical protein